MGSGKSSVAARLRELGARIIDADAIAREIVEPGKPALKELVDAFGKDILLPDGHLNRSRLAGRAFVSKEATAKLNAITHPRIAARTKDLFDEAGDKDIVVHDMPLLIENDIAADCHIVVVVHAPVDVRVARLVESRGVEEVDARRRIAAQIGDDERLAAADVVLDNSGTPAMLRRQVDDLYNDRLVPFLNGVHVVDPPKVRSRGRIDREVGRVERQLGVQVKGSVLTGDRLVLTVDGPPNVAGHPWRKKGRHWESMDPGNPVTLVPQREDT